MKFQTIRLAAQYASRTVNIQHPNTYNTYCCCQRHPRLPVKTMCCHTGKAGMSQLDTPFLHATSAAAAAATCALSAEQACSPNIKIQVRNTHPESLHPVPLPCLALGRTLLPEAPHSSCTAFLEAIVQPHTPVIVPSSYHHNQKHHAKQWGDHTTATRVAKRASESPRLIQILSSTSCTATVFGQMAMAWTTQLCDLKCWHVAAPASCTHASAAAAARKKNRRQQQGQQQRLRQRQAEAGLCATYRHCFSKS
jgi:hypothetical protein